MTFHVIASQLEDILKGFPRVYGLRKPRPANLDRLLKLTHYSRDELRLLYRHFKVLCPEGILTLETLCEVYASLFPQGQSEEYARFVHRAFDLNHDGFVDFEDLAVSYSILTRGTAGQRADWAFDFYDARREERVGRLQLLAVMKSVYALLGDAAQPPVHSPAIFAHMSAVFERITNNQSQYISRQQFVDYMLRDAALSQHPSASSMSNHNHNDDSRPAKPTAYRSSRAPAANSLANNVGVRSVVDETEEDGSTKAVNESADRSHSSAPSNGSQSTTTTRAASRAAGETEPKRSAADLKTLASDSVNEPNRPALDELTPRNECKTFTNVDSRSNNSCESRNQFKPVNHSTSSGETFASADELPKPTDDYGTFQSTSSNASKTPTPTTDTFNGSGSAADEWRTFKSTWTHEFHPKPCEEAESFGWASCDGLATPHSADLRRFGPGWARDGSQPRHSKSPPAEDSASTVSSADSFRTPRSSSTSRSSLADLRWDSALSLLADGHTPRAQP